ncbi:MAG: cytochrome P450 [Bacteroidota bacterium]
MSATSFPPRVPWYERLISQYRIISNILTTFSSYQQRFGEVFRVDVGSRHVYITTSADYAQHILVRNQKNYIKDRPTRLLKVAIGNGLLTSDGAYWLRQRRLIQPAFHKAQIEHLSQIIIDETAAQVDKWNPQQGPMDFHEAMVKLTLNVVTRSLFSSAISEASIERVDFCFNELLKLMVARIREPHKIAWYKLTGRMKYYDRMSEEMDEVLFDLIDRRKEDGVGEGDLLDMLYSAKDEETGESLTRQQLRDESIILFLAGHETTANGLTWTTLHLLEHPHILQKVREEIQTVLGDTPVQFQHLKQLSYLRRVILESMRLSPPAWVIGRQALKADQVGELSLQPTENMTIFIYGLHRNPAYWDSPEEFRPERFLPENIKARHSYAYLPFGGGPRLCIGNQFAMVEMQIALTTMLQRYDFARTSDEVIDFDPSITLRPKTKVWMKLIPRT